MEHAGEGHFSAYLTQEHTGLETYVQLANGKPKPAPDGHCMRVARAFKRYEHSTSCPSDFGSLIFGVHHSPFSGGLVTSSIRRISSDEFHLTVTGMHKWGFHAKSQKQKTFAFEHPMVIQKALFNQLAVAIARSAGSFEPRSNEPIAIHLEVDLFTYRALIMLAESYELCFRFYPIPVHQQFDEHRLLCEEKNWEEEKNGRSMVTLGGALEQLPVVKLPRSARYPVLAFCPACAKLLLPAEKLQCKGCKIAFYCNVDCQRKDWYALHKQECRKFSKLAAEADCEYCQMAGVSHPH